MDGLHRIGRLQQRVSELTADDAVADDGSTGAQPEEACGGG